MHSGSMSLRGYAGNCSGTSDTTHCYISVALCSSDVSPTFGLALPSSYQGNLWLLDNCQETHDEAPSCESPNCETKSCTTSCDQSNSSVPSSSPTVGKICSACETTNTGPSPSCNPCTQTKGYVSDCCTPSYVHPKPSKASAMSSNALGNLTAYPRVSGP